MLDILQKTLVFDPDKRISLNKLMKHNFFNELTDDEVEVTITYNIGKRESVGII